MVNYCEDLSGLVRGIQKYLTHTGSRGQAAGRRLKVLFLNLKAVQNNLDVKQDSNF